MTKEPTTPTPSAMMIKVVAPPENSSVWILSADVDLEWRVRVFPALPSSTEVFVCELAICMEIDQSPRFTTHVMNCQQLFCPVWIGGSISSSLSTFLITVFYLLRDCTDLVSLSP